ncbi:endonuclease/exonuclease/phosphatase family protein [Oricola thermophila]|uniref:Endonuclease/exonuclease/phosphatase family protein n=1 Tax=Oricola thermophila TaxID=2742145 RepID=A0A6N1VLA6_9HYPH|nr:endonuclease/exonuclease/phosphatase family protein [Oricola thermophila]QKV19999.1 endonuclease/exonuclease/phosphatase family protein [Oricola thermophila]
MTVRVATYNIQFGIGLDGSYNLERIVDAVRDADIIAFQEVTRGFMRNGGRDMVAEIGELLPDRFTVCHMPADIDFGSRVENGKAIQSRFQFGNMIVSRWPILSARGLLLPRSSRMASLNLQRGALEALIETPAGPFRFYSIHLDHIDPDERISQIAALKDIAFSAPRTGMAVTGLGEYGFPELPRAEDFLLLGDFNFEPDLAEYRDMLAENGTLVDATAADSGWSWTDPEKRKPNKRLDYGFATPALAERIGNVRVDRSAEGSDHMPVWMQINI